MAQPNGKELNLVKYRNTPGRSARTSRAAVFCLALATTLVALAALAGLAGFSASSAQERARKPARARKFGDQRGFDAAARQRLATRAAKPAKADTAAPTELTAALLACPAPGAETPISFDQTVNGVLDLQDCDFGDFTRYDIYRFDATAGQQVSLLMTSTAFDTYLFLVYDINGNGVGDAEDAEFGGVGEDDDGGAGIGPPPNTTNSRIPSGGGVATLPFTGRYFIIANAFPPPDTTVPTGPYTLNLTLGSGSCSPSPTTIGAAPINGSLGSPDCRFADDSFFDILSFTGNAGQQLSITLNATAPFTNGGAPVVWLLDAARNPLAIETGPARIPGSGLVTLPATGTYFVVAGSTPRTATFNPTPTGNYTLTIASGGQCPTTAINVGQTINNSLVLGECLLPDDTLADFYTFSGTAGQQIAIAMNSGSFDTYLYLLSPAGVVLTEDDDSGGGPDGTNSRIPASGFFTLPSTGTYTILANSFLGNPTPTGAYDLSLSAPSSAVTNVQLSTNALSATEGVDRSVLVTVTRTGETTGESFVSYATTDGSANERKDYTAALGRLRFAPGEITKTFEVVITDDAFAEGQETFTVALSNPVGAMLGTTTSATVTINSNDAVSGISPVRDAAFNTEFFVRQHYADFLNRVPDAGGLAFWTNQMTNCSDPPPADLTVCKVNVSAAFFLSIEFQETGFLAVRTHKVSFGNPVGKPVPLALRDFLSDSRRLSDNVIVGTPGWPEQLEANKQAYFAEFVTRTAFTALHPLSQGAAEYVDGLFATAGVLPTQAERDAAVASFGGGGTAGRAAALRKVAESETVKRAETNGAFVLMQYFGYLRRNPDDADFRGIPDPNFEGYNFWLTKLNSFNGNYVDAEMVKAFIQSIEYGDRFGQ